MLSLEKCLTANFRFKKITGEIICNVPSVRFTKGKTKNGMESKH